MDEIKVLLNSLVSAALKASNSADDKEAEKEPKKDGDDKAENKKACNEDKRKLIDEIGGILKGKVDEEVWRTIIGKVEKLSYEKSEAGAVDNKAKNEGEEPKEEPKKDDKKAENSGEEQIKKELDDKVNEAANKKAQNSIDEAVNQLYSAIMREPELAYVSAAKGLELGEQIYGK